MPAPESIITSTISTLPTLSHFGPTYKPVVEPGSARDGPLKLLLVEDEPTFAGMVQWLLSNSSQTELAATHVPDLAQATDRLRSQSYDAVLLDLNLADSQGLSTFRSLHALAPDVPFVVLTGINDSELALTAVREGAQDFLLRTEIGGGRVLWRVIRYAIERKRNAEALQGQTAFFRLITENVTDLISVTDREGRRLYNNRSYQSVLGDPDALRGTNAFVEIHPDDRDRIRAVFQQTVTTGIGQRAEFRFLRSDGGIRYMQSEGSAVKDASGQVAWVVVVSRDITDRRIAEEALHQSEQRYKRLLASITDYIYTVIIEQGRAIATIHNLGCAAVTGYAEEDYAADENLWFRMVHEADRAAVLDQADRAQHGEETPPLEHRIIHKDGSLCWVRNSIVLRRNSHGRLVAYDGLVTNITARKRAEERQAVQYVVARTLADSATLGEAIPGILRAICEQLEWDLGAYWTVDPEAGLLRCQEVCNRVGERALPFELRTRSAVFPAGTGFPGRIWRSAQPEWLAQTGAFDCPRATLAIETGLNAAFGFPILLREQVQGIMEFFSREIRRPEPEMLDVFSPIGNQIGQFIERRRAEERLQQACSDLSRRGEDLARANVELRSAHEELQATQMHLIQAARLELAGALASSVAHDVRNPLANILMNARLLTTVLISPDETVRTALNDIRSDVDRARCILNDLLQLSRRTQLNRLDEDLHAVINQSLRFVKLELNRVHATVIREFSPELPAIPLDRSRMEEVLVNLFTNAAQAMPEGGMITIRTRLRQIAPEEARKANDTNPGWYAGETAAEMEIDNPGDDIPEEELTRIFELQHSSRRSGRSGLGLWIVKNLIDLHGGLIAIRNRPEGGVRVTLTLKTNSTTPKEL